MKKINERPDPRQRWSWPLFIALSHILILNFDKDWDSILLLRTITHYSKIIELRYDLSFKRISIN